jgi:uncharacterized protein YdeI (YjbR/CyaY-like superfamily)
MLKANTASEYIDLHPEWKTELLFLRDLITETEMVETIKWGSPVYTINGKNVVGLGAFKSYVGLWFFQGVFLKDSENLLVTASEGKTKALRQWKFNSIDEMNGELILAYIKEAIANQKAGKELKPETSKTYEMAKELAEILKQSKLLKNAFFKLSIGKQKEYSNYILEAKQLETKHNRIEKIKPMIEAGLGLNDKYRNC